METFSEALITEFRDELVSLASQIHSSGVSELQKVGPEAVVETGPLISFCNLILSWGIDNGVADIQISNVDHGAQICFESSQRSACTIDIPYPVFNFVLVRYLGMMDEQKEVESDLNGTLNIKWKGQIHFVGVCITPTKDNLELRLSIPGNE
ncbi:MAG: hypothetical protein ABJA67_10975 [Chthonomonadales bacterium]